MRRRTVLAWLGAIALLSVALVACSPEAATRSEAVSTNQVLMAKSYRFEPTAIRISPGTTVTWRNDDNFTHTVHLLGGDGWQSESVGPGGSTSHTFTQAGEFSYECGFHPQNMKGKIVVG